MCWALDRVVYQSCREVSAACTHPEQATMAAAAAAVLNGGAFGGAGTAGPPGARRKRDARIAAGTSNHRYYAGFKRGAPLTTVEEDELEAALAAARATLAATAACVAEERRKREAAEARAAIAVANEAKVATGLLTEQLISLALGRGPPVNVAATEGAAGGDMVLLPQQMRCRDDLRALCGADSAAGADVSAAAAAVEAASLAAQALELAHVLPHERKELDDATGTASVQRLMNDYLSALVGALLPDAAAWTRSAELATALLHDREEWGFHIRAGGALLPHPERHANVVTAQLTASYVGGGSPVITGAGTGMAGGIRRGRQQAAIRLAHALVVRYYDLYPRPAVLPAGRLAAYSLVADGFQLYIVCVEVAYKGKSPCLVVSWHGPLRLWSKSLMDYAERRDGAAAPALADCCDADAPGLVALVKLLRAGRSVLGEAPYTVPADLMFGRDTPTLPPPREWIHLGSGGASESYSTVAAGGQFVVVKVSRQPNAEWQPLGTEAEVYAALGAAGACAAIPVLLGTARAPDGKAVAALALSSGSDGAETVPVDEVLTAAGDRIVIALSVVWSVVVALRHAHSACVVHRDVRGDNAVWKVGALQPSVSNVAAAIAAATAGVSGGGGGGDGLATAEELVPPPAQLVDWGVATIHSATSSNSAEYCHGVKEDVQRLYTLLLPSLLRVDVDAATDELAARLRCPPDVVRGHLDVLEAASSATEAALPVLHLLHLALLVSDDAAANNGMHSK